MYDCYAGGILFKKISVHVEFICKRMWIFTPLHLPHILNIEKCTHLTDAIKLIHSWFFFHEDRFISREFLDCQRWPTCRLEPKGHQKCLSSWWHPVGLVGWAYGSIREQHKILFSVLWPLASLLPLLQIQNRLYPLCPHSLSIVQVPHQREIHTWTTAIQLECPRLVNLHPDNTSAKVGLSLRASPFVNLVLMQMDWWQFDTRANSFEPWNLELDLSRFRKQVVRFTFWYKLVFKYKLRLELSYF